MDITDLMNIIDEEKMTYEERDKYSKEYIKKLKHIMIIHLNFCKFVSYIYQNNLHYYVENGPFKTFYDDHKIEDSFEGIFGGDFIEWLDYYKDKFNYDGFIKPKDRIRDLIMH